jgi:hypothetical protein
MFMIPTVVKDNIAPGENDIKQSKYHKHAIQILEGLGGQDNILLDQLIHFHLYQSYSS